MEQLIHSLQNLLAAGWEVVLSLLIVVVPWTPLIAWVAFWLLAVNWEKLYPILAKGGVVGVMLIGLVAILVWGWPSIAVIPLQTSATVWCWLRASTLQNG